LSVLTRRPERPLAGDVAGDRPAESAAAGRRTWRAVAGPVVSRITTALAVLLIVVVLVAPNDPARLTPLGFVRIPAELLQAVALILVLRAARARRLVAISIGLVFGVLAVLKGFDLGFHAVFARPFEPASDWSLFRPAVEFLTGSIGRTGAVLTVIGAAALVVALLVLLPLATLRLARLVSRHRTAATRSTLVLVAAWVACAALGVQAVPGVPVAGSDYGRLVQVGDAVSDHRAFLAENSADAFRDTPGDRLLTALRGKDVVLAFVESYGRDAIEDPEFAPTVRPVLDEGSRRLAADGYGARSGWLTSPTAGGGSWLAHATLLSGVWIDNQRRYRNLVGSERLTLNGAFRRADWRTVGVMPGVIRDWPEGEFYGYDRMYARADLGYQGPEFTLSTMPDQYTLSAFQRLERATAGAGPVMAEIPLASSHAPWAPVPRMIGWDEVGDGAVYRQMDSSDPPRSALRDAGRLRAGYRDTIAYSLRSVISYVQRYGDDDLVLVFLGDHQPTPIVTGPNASHDVPITIVTRDRAVLDRISGWGWQEGLRPGPGAPVWPMNAFRDRFLTAFGPTASG
jgi:hypothetical protein